MTISVWVSELYADVHAYDHASTMLLPINDIPGQQVPLTLYTDAKSLFDGLVNLAKTVEKRLLINLKMMSEAYEQR